MSVLVKLTLGTVAANPPWVALAGAVDGVAGAVVGAVAGRGAVFPKVATGTHCRHQQTSERFCSSLVPLCTSSIEL